MGQVWNGEWVEDCRAGIKIATGQSKKAILYSPSPSRQPLQKCT